MKRYQIINTWDDEEKYEYDINVEDTDEGTVYSMYYSNNETWSDTVRGKLINRATDDGNKYKFHNKFDRKMDYSKIAEAIIFLQFINLMDRMVGYRVQEVNLIAEI